MPQRESRQCHLNDASYTHEMLLVLQSWHFGSSHLRSWHTAWELNVLYSVPPRIHHAKCPCMHENECKSQLHIIYNNTESLDRAQFFQCLYNSWTIPDVKLKLSGKWLPPLHVVYLVIDAFPYNLSIGFGVMILILGVIFPVVGSIFLVINLSSTLVVFPLKAMHYTVTFSEPPNQLVWVRPPQLEVICWQHYNKNTGCITPQYTSSFHKLSPLSSSNFAVCFFTRYS